MALVLADRVKETTTTTGTGTVTLLGASTGYQSFAAVGNANTTYYTIAGQTGSEWEVGIGTYTSAGTTLSRDTVLASSNGGSLVTFSAGTKDVFVTYPAGRSVYANGTVLTATNSSILPTTSGGTGLTSLTAGYIPFGAGTSAFGSSSSLFWDSVNNRLGIGTTSPAQKLDVQGNTIVSGYRYFTNTNNWMQYDGTSVLGIRTGGDFVLYTGGFIERLRALSSGNIGIGTSSPVAPLSVSISNAISSPTVTIANTDVTSAGIVRANFLSGDDGTVGRTRALIEAASDSANNGRLSFYTRNAGTLVEAMRITYAGGVSFGSSGTNYGTAGQVLTSAGNAPPTWTNSVTQIIAGTNVTISPVGGTGAVTINATSGSSAYTRTSFTATAGQTVFSVTYAVGYLQVYVNGVLLATSDYTATNGTSFTLGVACAVGDIVEALVITTSVVGVTTGKSIAMAMIFGY